MRLRTQLPRRRSSRGFSLVELMVAVVLGVVIVLAISKLMASMEGQNRTTTSTNDIDQAGNYAAYFLDRAVRSGGSAFVQASSFTLGCKIDAVDNGTQVLPMTAAPTDFPNLTQRSFYLIPALILPGQSYASDGSGGTHTSDLLVVMEGVNGNNNVPTPFVNVPTSSSLGLISSVGFSTNDVLLASDVASGGNLTDCLLDEVSVVGTGGVLTLGGTYHAGDSVAARKLSTMSSNGLAIDLGNYTAGAPPIFEVLGVGPNTILYSYDLFSQTQQAIVNGVFEIHALYGVDTTGAGVVNSWVAPSGNYSVANLTAGTTAAAALVQTIKAVRIGLILRTQLKEKTAVTPGPITLFSDLGSSLPVTRTLSSTEQYYRYRTVDLTVPLQNVLQ